MHTVYRHALRTTAVNLNIFRGNKSRENKSREYEKIYAIEMIYNDRSKLSPREIWESWKLAPNDMFLLTLTVLFLKDEPDEKVMKKYDQKYDAKVTFPSLLLV